VQKRERDGQNREIEAAAARGVQADRSLKKINKRKR
jgi:hypothetical protein